MAVCRGVCDYIEKLCPLSYACDWDNVGLLVGDSEREISKILICLDNDEKVVNEAIKLGVDMIISHHPIMFTPINRITSDTPQGRMIAKMCANLICHYDCHTNMDSAKGGLNDYLARKLGLERTCVMEETSEGAGFGRKAELDGDVTLEDMISLCEDRLNLKTVNYVGDLDKKITTVAVNCGSGSSVLEQCIKDGVDLLVTGDLKYSVAREAYENNVAVIDAGHYGTEIIFTELMEEYLKKEFSDIEILISRANVPVLKTHIK